MDFDISGIQTAGLLLATISMAGIGMILAGSFLFQEAAEQYKRMIPTVLVGLVLMAVGGGLITAFGG